MWILISWPLHEPDDLVTQIFIYENSRTRANRISDSQPVRVLPTAVKLKFFIIKKKKKKKILKICFFFVHFNAKKNCLSNYWKKTYQITMSQKVIQIRFSHVFGGTKNKKWNYLHTVKYELHLEI